MCCPSKSCCLCTLLVLVILAIGFVFGFGVFAHGFNKIRDALHLGEAGQKGFSGAAPPPF